MFRKRENGDYTFSIVNIGYVIIQKIVCLLMRIVVHGTLLHHSIDFVLLGAVHRRQIGVDGLCVIFDASPRLRLLFGRGVPLFFWLAGQRNSGYDQRSVFGYQTAIIAVFCFGGVSRLMNALKETFFLRIKRFFSYL